MNIIEKKKDTKETMATLLLIVVAVIWGGGFVVTKMSVDTGFPPSLVLSIRFIIGVLFMLAIFWRDIKKATSNDIKIGIIAGVILFLAFITQTIGVKYTTPSNNAFITSTNVVMVPFISWMLLGKRPALKTIILSFTCFLGMVVLSYSPDLGLAFNIGDILTFVCAFCYACHISFLGLSAGKITSVTAINCIQLGVAGVISTVYFFAVEYTPISMAQISEGIWGLLFLGIFSTGLCFLMQGYAQKILPPVRIAIMLSLEGMFGSIISVLCGYDKLGLNLILGGIIILSSMIILEVDLITLINRKREPQ